MESPAGLTEPCMHSQAPETREAKRLMRILGETDLYVAFFRLKCGHFKQPVKLDDRTLEKLAEYIERYTSHAHIIDTRFSSIMNALKTTPQVPTSRCS